MRLHRLRGGKTNRAVARDFYELFGYPYQIYDRDYIWQFQRDAMSNRIITAYPDACWTGLPKLFQLDKNGEKMDGFAEKFSIVASKLKLLHYLHRLDTLTQLVNMPFSLLLLREFRWMYQ